MSKGPIVGRTRDVTAESALSVALREPSVSLDHEADGDSRSGATDVPRRTRSRIAVALRDVSMIYPNGRRALNDVDLVVPEGDFVFLVGPSGAGKSTLVRLLVRDELATRGEVFIAGYELSSLGGRDVPRLRRQIGIVFQDFKLLPRKTVRENVAFALEVTGTSRSRIGPAVDRVLALVGLSAQASQRPSQLSGGEQQRAAVARALAADPLVVLADEPSGNLDSANSERLHQLFAHLSREFETALVVVTHNRSLAGRADRVLSLEDGRLVPLSGVEAMP